MAGNNRGQAVGTHWPHLVGDTQASRLPVTLGSQGWTPGSPLGLQQLPYVELLSWAFCLHCPTQDPGQPVRKGLLGIPFFIQ